jgi:SIR2-like domain
VYSGKGVYALLAGSGVSRAAEIPTGWDVTLDLIRRHAAVSAEDCEPDPENWYRKKYGTDPDYSTLLENLAINPSERTNLLAAYFEATPEDRDLGKKTPTAAHKAIARLASKGYFRVIVTTNFDRLIEQALEAEGVNPTTISTADMASGAMPLTHAQCTVIKVHGDYRDTRLRNTSAELAVYSSELNVVLDRIFDEYGLIVCGWSATWDRALREAILRSPNRRFSAFWGVKGAPSSEAVDVIKFRQASILEIGSADALFLSLEQKIEALESFDKPHPLSIPIAIASLKRFITEERFRIDLRDLIQNEVERQVKALAPLSIEFTNFGNEAAKRESRSRMELYESSMEMLVALIAHGCFYGTVAQTSIWQEAIQRIASISIPRGGSAFLFDLCRYPACLLSYAGGIASVASNDYVALRVILRDSKTARPIAYDNNGNELIRGIVPDRVVGAGILDDIGNRIGTPVSDHLHMLLRDPLRPLIPGDTEYDETFDRFEYFFALVHFEVEWSKRKAAPTWAFMGRFIRRNRGFGAFGTHVSDALTSESEAAGKDWAPIRDGLFKNFESFKDLNDTYREKILSRVDAVIGVLGAPIG